MYSNPQLYLSSLVLFLILKVVDYGASYIENHAFLERKNIVENMLMLQNN
jgi:hypothetical protein